MKHLALIVIFALVSLRADAQICLGCTSAAGIPQVSALPSTCSPQLAPNVVFLTTGTIGVYACQVNDNWTFLGSGSGSVTSVGLAGTLGQVNISGPSAISTFGSWGVSIADPFTFPGRAVSSASTTARAGLNIPTGAAPTSPVAGDVWNLSGVLQYRNQAGATRSLMTTADLLALAQTPLTTRGDMFYVDGTPALARLPKGANGTVLVMGANDPGWGTTINGTAIPASKTLMATDTVLALAQTPATTRGDLITVNSAPGLVRLAKGTQYQTLQGGLADLLWDAVHLDQVSAVTGALPLANGGTGQTTAAAALNALLPSQTGNNGKYLTTNGTDASWISLVGGGDVLGPATNTNGFIPTWNGANSKTLGNGIAAPTGALVGVGQANTYTAGAKQTVSQSTTTAGLNLGALSTDPSSPVDGDFWKNAGNLFVRQSAATKQVAFTDSNITGTAAGLSAVLAKSQGGAGADMTNVTFPASGTISTVVNPTTAAAVIGDGAVVVGDGGARGIKASALTAAVVKMTAGVPSAAVVGTDYMGMATALVKAQTPLTTKGDLFAFDGTTLHRLPVGSNGQVLTADSAQTDGIKWAAGPGTGTVTVVGGGALSSGALMVGGGTTTSQTPCTTCTLDSNGVLTVATVVTTGGGTGAGFFEFGQGTAPSLGTNAVTVYAPASVTSYGLVLPGSSATGFLFGTDAAGTNSLSWVGSSGTGNVARVNSPTFTTPTLGAALATSINGTGIPTSKTLMATDTILAIAQTPMTSRGDLMLATGASPALGRLAKGSQYQVLSGGATEPSWGAVALDQATATSGILPGGRGGTGTTNFSATGATALRAYTFPDADATMVATAGAYVYSAGSKHTFSQSATTAGFNLGALAIDPSSPVEGDGWYNNGAIKFRDSAATRILATLDGAQTLSNKTILTPTIGSFANANHNHTNAAGGGQITDAALSAAVGSGKGGTGVAGTLSGIPMANGASPWTAAVPGTDFSRPNASETITASRTIGSGGSIAPTSATVGVVSANQLNGVSLAGLSTGLLKITTSTGIPSIATYADVIALFGAGACSGYLKSDGTCDSGAGGSMVYPASGVAVSTGSGWGTSLAVATAATANAIAQRNASGEVIAANTVATGKTAMATDTAVADAQLAAKHKTRVQSFTIFDPVTGDSGRTQVTFPYAITITSVSCSVKAATSATINLDERVFATPDTAGTAVLTSGLACDTDGATSTTFSNAGIAANVPLALTISAVSGTPDTLRVFVTYTID